MNKFGMVVFWLFLFLALPGLTGEAAASSQPDLPVCLPATWGRPVTGECTPVGPQTYAQKMAAQGVQLPLRPFTAQVIDPVMSYVNYQYMWVRDDAGPVALYNSLADAQAGSNVARYLETNFSYVTYAEIVETDNGKYVLLDSGLWVSRGQVTPVSTPRSQGVHFPTPPSRDFGWLFDFLTPRLAPGYNSPLAAVPALPVNALVQIYATETADGVAWNKIGPDQWVEARLVNQVALNPNPPQGVDNGRWIEINLAEQTLAVYDQRRLVFATVIASGLDPLWTRPGLFPITQKLETTPMSGATTADRSDFYYLENVPWTMYFDEARALHGAYWRTKLGHPQSHGCVNLTIGDAHWIFDWAQEGDWVYVWDPSGRTPTDPSFYGAGGA